MKKILLAITFSLAAMTSAMAANVHVEAQQEYLKRIEGKFATDYKCPIKWTMEEKNFNMTSAREGSKFAGVIGGVEYELRLKCQAGGFTKIDKVVFTAGSTSIKPDDCSEADNKDGAKVALSGKTLTIACKYNSCYCADNASEAQTKEILSK